MDIQLRTGNFLDSRKVPKPYYKIYSLNLKFPLCQKAVTYFIYMYCKVASINACYKFKKTFLVKRSQYIRPNSKNCSRKYIRTCDFTVHINKICNSLLAKRKFQIQTVYLVMRLWNFPGIKKVSCSLLYIH